LSQPSVAPHHALRPRPPRPHPWVVERHPAGSAGGEHSGRGGYPQLLQGVGLLLGAGDELIEVDGIEAGVGVGEAKQTAEACGSAPTAERSAPELLSRSLSSCCHCTVEVRPLRAVDRHFPPTGGRWPCVAIGGQLMIELALVLIVMSGST